MAAGLSEPEGPEPTSIWTEEVPATAWARYDQKIGVCGAFNPPLLCPQVPETTVPEWWLSRNSSAAGAARRLRISFSGLGIGKRPQDVYDRLGSAQTVATRPQSTSTWPSFPSRPRCRLAASP